MKLLPTTALNTMNEIVRVCANRNSREDTLGYFVSNQVIILQPKYLCEEEYNRNYVERIGLPIIEIPARGGTIVCNTGDLGFLYITEDMHSNWNRPAQKYVARYLRKIYGIDTEVNNNDVLIDGKKFIGTASGFMRNKHVCAMFISMNNATTWLINKICTKESHYAGFIGLDRYSVCPKRLINTVINFSKHWERRGL